MMEYKCDYCWDTGKVWPIFGEAVKCRRCPPKVVNVFARFVFDTRNFDAAIKRLQKTMRSLGKMPPLKMPRRVAGLRGTRVIVDDPLLDDCDPAKTADDAQAWLNRAFAGRCQNGQ